MSPGDNLCPYDSAHHLDTSEGDTFGGLGTSKEYREEDLYGPGGILWSSMEGSAELDRYDPARC
jgi:hypothetical protein